MVDTMERQDGRRRGRLALPLLAALLVVATVLAGRFWSGAEQAAEGPLELTGVHLASARGSAPGQTSSGPGQGKANPGQGQPNNPGNQLPAPPGDTPPNPRTFGISGNLEDVYPTFAGHLTVTFTNPHPFDIVVTELIVEIGLPDDAACANAIAGLDAIFAVGDTSAINVHVGQRSSTTYDVDFAVSNDLPNECQNVSFPLTYSGTAIRANQQ